MENFNKENPARKTTFKVIKNAKDVRINKVAIRNLAKKLLKEKTTVPLWPDKMHFVSKNSRKQLDYLFILDALNFCFWSKKALWRFNYKRKYYHGYFALALALKKFFEENPEKSEINYLAGISFPEFRGILDKGKNLLFLKKRWKILRGVAKTLVKNYHGDSREFIASAKHRLSNLIPKIAKELPSFNDEAIYNGKKVYLWKRTQILPMDIWGVFKGRGFGKFNDLAYPTAFPDYKLPQILQALNILNYSYDLKTKIEKRKNILANSREEVEIRAATIWAVEYLTKELKKGGKKIHPFQADWILWNKSQKFPLRLPHHLTKTIFY